MIQLLPSRSDALAELTLLIDQCQRFHSALRLIHVTAIDHRDVDDVPNAVETCTRKFGIVVLPLVEQLELRVDTALHRLANVELELVRTRRLRKQLASFDVEFVGVVLDDLHVREGNTIKRFRKSTLDTRGAYQRCCRFVNARATTIRESSSVADFPQR